MIRFYRKYHFINLCESNLRVGVPLDEDQRSMLVNGFEWDSSATLLFGEQTKEAFRFWEPFARGNPPPPVTQLFLDRLAAVAHASDVTVPFPHNPIMVFRRVRGPSITLEIT